MTIDGSGSDGFNEREREIYRVKESWASIPCGFETDEEDDEEANIDSDDDLESISARGGGADADSDSVEEAPKAVNAKDSDEDDSSFRTFTIAHLDATNAGGGFGNTKIKTENLSSYTTVKIENSDGTKDNGAQGTSSAGPIAPAGSLVPELLLKKTPRKSSLRTF
ncbi:histone acetyltransferase gcn5 [Quercus suber]|uniref:Histone acetyltransferase gcn5 n=1 Tax=Quercus suber TaxID=58331 RepID=A0AAW0K9H0_QUESU|nr:histone acetyltransferase gcn5 [Quercus suber]